MGKRAQLFDTFPLGDAACTCERCSGKRSAAVQDRLERATPGERYIARALTTDGGSGPRDAYIARQELAYLRPGRR